MRLSHQHKYLANKEYFIFPCEPSNIIAKIKRKKEAFFREKKTYFITISNVVMIFFSAFLVLEFFQFQSNEVYSDIRHFGGNFALE